MVVSIDSSRQCQSPLPPRTVCDGENGDDENADGDDGGGDTERKKPESQS